MCLSVIDGRLYLYFISYLSQKQLDFFWVFSIIILILLMNDPANTTNKND